MNYKSVKQNLLNQYLVIKINTWLLAILFAISFNNIYATGNEDTLNNAKVLLQSGKYAKAEKLLKALHQSHPDDLNIFWLYGQSAYGAKHYKTFNASYTKAINQFPANYYLKLDYALKLVKNGDIKKAIPLLKIYKSYDPTSSDLKLALAKIQYWQGSYTEALQTLNSKTFEKEKDIEIFQLKQDILMAKSPWLKFNFNYSSDDQPLQVITPKLEAGVFSNRFLSPYISVASQLFQQSADSKSAVTFTAGNKLNLIKAGLTLNLNGGYIQMPDKSQSLTGNIEVTKTCYNHFQLYTQAAHQPYLATTSSLSNAIIPYHYSFSAGWNNLNSWNGKIVSNVDKFSDGENYIYNLSGWLFAPPFIFSNIKLQIGYAYAYAWSKENRFTSKASIANVISNYNAGSTYISGIYNPYFTPNNQSVHSALFNIYFQPSKHLSIGSNANLGFLGKTENPYLFLDKKNGVLFINKNYSEVKFYPDEISFFLLYQLTNKISFKLDYIFLRNNFYINLTVCFPDT